MIGVQAIEKMAKKDIKKDERSDQISFKLAADDKLAFDVLVRKSGEDITGVLRHMIKTYISAAKPEIERQVEQRRKEDLIAALRKWVIANRENPNHIEWITQGLGLKSGELARLAEDDQ